MAWRIELGDKAVKELAKLDKAAARRITQFLRKRIAPLDDPRELATPLKGKLGELWRYRVGDYRVICELHDEVLIVLVVRIGHRKAVYR